MPRFIITNANKYFTGITIINLFPVQYLQIRLESEFWQNVLAKKSCNLSTKKEVIQNKIGLVLILLLLQKQCWMFPVNMTTELATCVAKKMYIYLLALFLQDR